VKNKVNIVEIHLIGSFLYVVRPGELGHRRVNDGTIERPVVLAASHLHQSCQISFRNMQPGQPEHHGFIRTGLMGEESIVNHEINAQAESRSNVTMIRDVSLNRTQFVY